MKHPVPILSVPVWNRLATILLVAVGTGTGVASRGGVADAEPAAAGVGTPAHRVTQRIVVRGELFAPAGRDVAPVSVPIVLEGHFAFEESLRPPVGSPADESEPHATAGLETDLPPAGDRRWRTYHEARVEVEAAGTKTMATLPADARALCVTLVGMMPVPHLPAAHLARAESDLLETPFDAALVDGLLPADPVVVEGSWTVPADRVAGLVAIDTVATGGITATLTSLEAGSAVIRLSGTVDGGIDGAPTHVVVEGTCTASVPQDHEPDGPVALTGPVTNVAVVMRERRQASHVAPGLDVEARIDLTRAAAADRSPAAAPDPDAAPPAARRPPRRAGDPVDLVWTADARGIYDVVHDPRWREVEAGAESRVLRLVDHGALVCQCSIAARRGGAVAVPTPTELEHDIRRSLGGQFRRCVEAAEVTRPDGGAGVRVVTVGDADGVPFRWIHYVLGDPAGHRAEVTFMLEEAVAGRFADRDRAFVDRLAFRAEPPGPQAPENAP